MIQKHIIKFSLISLIAALNAYATKSEIITAHPESSAEQQGKIKYIKVAISIERGSNDNAWIIIAETANKLLAAFNEDLDTPQQLVNAVKRSLKTISQLVHANDTNGKMAVQQIAMSEFSNRMQTDDPISPDQMINAQEIAFIFEVEKLNDEACDSWQTVMKNTRNMIAIRADEQATIEDAYQYLEELYNSCSTIKDTQGFITISINDRTSPEAEEQ